MATSSTSKQAVLERLWCNAWANGFMAARYHMDCFDMTWERAYELAFQELKADQSDDDLVTDISRWVG